MDDNLTLVPVYEMTWADGSSRRTDEPDAFDSLPVPDVVEAVAQAAREDPECESVELVSMANADGFQ